MATHPGEDEQLEALKKWWQENGNVTVIGFVVGIAVLFGGKAWFDHKQTQSEQASSDLALLLNELNVGDDESIADQAELLVEQYGDSSSASFAAFIKAKTEVEAGNIDEAKSILQSVIDKPILTGLDDLARLRLARLLVAESNYDQALTLISGGKSSFKPHFAELRGDILSAQGKVDDARVAYELALENPAVLASGQDVRMKLDSLGEVAESNDSEGESN